MYKRRVIIDNDGGDVFYCQGASYEDFTASRMRGLIGTGATTLFYTPVSSGFSVFTHHTKIGSVRTLHEPRHPRNIVGELMAQGTDCLHYASRFCRENGLEIFFGMRMNDTHDGTGQSYSETSLHNNAFKLAHPEHLLGTREQLPAHGAWTAVNYLHEEVRDLAFRLLQEACQNYDLDGVHLDFFRHPVFFPNPSQGLHASGEEIAAMTSLMRRVRAMVRAESQALGRPLSLSVRVPDSLPYALFLGLDLAAWLEEGLVDLLCTSSYLQLNEWRYSVELGHRAGVPVYPALDETRIQDKEANALRAAPAGMRARCANVFASGADGVLLFNYIVDAVRNAEERLPVIADIADDQRLARAEKTYFVSYRGIGAVAGGAPDHLTYQRVPVLNPAAPLSIQDEGTVELEIGDPRGGASQVWLWLSEPAEVQVFLNGADLGRAGGLRPVFAAQGLRAGPNRLRLVPAKPVLLLDAAIHVEEEKEGNGQ